jgi:hypothetical protein
MTCVLLTSAWGAAASTPRSGPDKPTAHGLRHHSRFRAFLANSPGDDALRHGQLKIRVAAQKGTIFRLSIVGRLHPTGRFGPRVTLIRARVYEVQHRSSVLRVPLTEPGRRLFSKCEDVQVTIVARRLSLGGERKSATGRSRHTLEEPRHCHTGHPPPVHKVPRPTPGAATFVVGAAKRSITPPSAAYATHVGGYGDCKDCPTTTVTPGDDIDVRAMVVRQGKHVAVLVSADLEGWFAGYKQGPDLGLTDLRANVASDLSGAGLDAHASDVIVQSVHCHACPTVVGIWGPTNLSYLRFVYAQTRAVVLDALHRARPAVLAWQTGDIGYVNDVIVGQANANEGWPIDAQLSILRAVDANTGAPISTWAEVPAHGNIVFGPHQHAMSSDYFGAADRWLEAHLGGVAIVGPGTLGDQTTPMQGDSDPQHVLGVIARLGALVGSTVEVGLRDHPHVITDATVAGTETYLAVPYTNPLLSGDDCNSAIARVVGIPLDRSCDPPYSISAALLGVWFTTLRIGPVAIASEPGEAFPHVTFATRRVISGAQAVFTPGQAQDQLGYYYEPWAFPTTFVYSADHNIFHASMALAAANEQVEIPNGRALGFGVTPSASDPTGNDFTRVTKPGVQAWGYPQPLGTARPKGERVWIGVYRAGARSTQVGVGSGAPDPRVDFGDGSQPVTLSSPPGASSCCIEVEHTFPHAGDWKVTAALPGTGESWTTTVHVLDPYTVWNSARYPAHGVLGP